MASSLPTEAEMNMLTDGYCKESVKTVIPAVIVKTIQLFHDSLIRFKMSKAELIKLKQYGELTNDKGFTICGLKFNAQLRGIFQDKFHDELIVKFGVIATFIPEYIKQVEFDRYNNYNVEWTMSLWSPQAQRNLHYRSSTISADDAYVKEFVKDYGLSIPLTRQRIEEAESIEFVADINIISYIRKNPENAVRFDQNLKMKKHSMLKWNLEDVSVIDSVKDGTFLRLLYVNFEAGCVESQLSADKCWFVGLNAVNRLIYLSLWQKPSKVGGGLFRYQCIVEWKDGTSVTDRTENGTLLFPACPANYGGHGCVKVICEGLSNCSMIKSVCVQVVVERVFVHWDDSREFMDDVAKADWNEYGVED